MRVEWTTKDGNERISGEMTEANAKLYAERMEKEGATKVAFQ